MRSKYSAGSQRGELDPAQMRIAAKLREALAADGLAAPGEVLDVKRASDGTRKLLVGMKNGARVECVLIPMTRLSEDDADADAAATGELDDGEALPPERTRVTLCISTQFGCAMGCTFCASGRAGLGRGLDAGEIVSQVILSRRYLEPEEDLRNLVFMGMGEPLHHYDQTARALRLLIHPDGGGISPRASR